MLAQYSPRPTEESSVKPEPGWSDSFCGHNCNFSNRKMLSHSYIVTSGNWERKLQSGKSNGDL